MKTFKITEEKTGVLKACRECTDRHVGCREGCICGKILKDMALVRERKRYEAYRGMFDDNIFAGYQHRVHLRALKEERRKR